MISLLSRCCLLAACLMLLLIPAPGSRDLRAAPGPPLLSGRDCGSTLLLAMAQLSQDSRWDESNRVAIDNPTSPQRSPAVAVDQDGRLQLLFTDARNDAGDIYTAYSSDFGQTWSTGLQVSDAISGTLQHNPAVWITADGTRHAVWNDERRNLNDIYSAYSSDGGQTWSANIRASLDAGVAPRSAPQLVGTADVLLAGWVQQSTSGAAGGNLTVVRSDDGGQTWMRTDPVNIQPDTVFDGGFNLATHPGTGRLYAVWLGIPVGAGDATQIMLAHSDDAGETWSTPLQINDPTEDDVKAAPVLAIDPGSGRILAAWEEYRNFTPQIRLISSSDGQAWSASVQVDSGTGSAYDPKLVIDSRGTGHCIYCEEQLSGSANIYAAEIDQALQISSEPISDEPISTSQSLLSVVIDGQDTIYAFWTSGTTSGEGIFAARRPSPPSPVYLPFIVQ